MDWHDLIIPTNPAAAIFFGIAFTIIVTALIWVETKETKTAIYTLLISSGVVLMLVGILYLIGFY